MRLTNSTYSSLKSPNKIRVLLIAHLFIAVLSFTACVKNSERNIKAKQTDATGKGNGGNHLSLSDQELEAIFKELKPKLKIVFGALKNIVLTEKSSPGSTDLAGNTRMIQNLLAMFDGDAPALKDLETPDNIQPQDKPCKDFRNHNNAAAAILGEIGGVICFSRSEIKSAAIKNFDHAAEVFVLGLATHEFVHHFVKDGSQSDVEDSAREIQEFVEQQLVRQLEISDDSTISIDEDQYIDQFHRYAQSLAESVIPEKADTD